MRLLNDQIKTVPVEWARGRLSHYLRLAKKIYFQPLAHPTDVQLGVEGQVSKCRPAMLGTKKMPDKNSPWFQSMQHLIPELLKAFGPTKRQG
ncbi:hypothetical protein AV641_12325 [Pseudomonas fragi]|nr:hypothetical protein AV641_12325 [Pseudomonas fragi]